jgi:phytoene synthase
MRLQWWRDALSEIFDGQPREHAVVAALAQAVRAQGLPRDAMKRLIDARETDLEAAPPADFAALEDYAGRSAGPLLELTFKALGVAAAPELCQRLAAPQALSGLMLALPFRALHGRVDLPQDLLREAGLVPEAVIEPSARSAVAGAVRRVAERAEALRRGAVAEVAALPSAARPGLLSLTLAKRNLARLARVSGDPFDPALGRRDGFLSARLWWAARTGRF